MGTMSLSEHSVQSRDGHGITCTHSCGLCPLSSKKQLHTSGPPFSTKDRAHDLWVPVTLSTSTVSVHSIPCRFKHVCKWCGGPIQGSDVPHVSVPRLQYTGWLQAVNQSYLRQCRLKCYKICYRVTIISRVHICLTVSQLGLTEVVWGSCLSVSIRHRR